MIFRLWFILLDCTISILFQKNKFHPHFRKKFKHAIVFFACTPVALKRRKGNFQALLLLLVPPCCCVVVFETFCALPL